VANKWLEYVEETLIKIPAITIIVVLLYLVQEIKSDHGQMQASFYADSVGFSSMLPIYI
jgi:hypothetical protein